MLHIQFSVLSSVKTLVPVGFNCQEYHSVILFVAVRLLVGHQKEYIVFPAQIALSAAHFWQQNKQPRKKSVYVVYTQQILGKSLNESLCIVTLQQWQSMIFRTVTPKITLFPFTQKKTQQTHQVRKAKAVRLCFISSMEQM